jgi:methyl-accepting chemotaxis protein
MHDTMLTVFTGVLAAVLLVQSLVFIGIYKSIRQLAANLDRLGKDLLREIEGVSKKVDEGLTTIKAMGEGLKPIKDKLSETTSIVYNRVADLDLFLAEVTRSARLGMLRIQDTIDSASRRAEETLKILHDNILAPLNEITAITQGVRAGLNILFRRRRNPSSTSLQDEEMFI